MDLKIGVFLLVLLKKFGLQLLVFGVVLQTFSRELIVVNNDGRWLMMLHHSHELPKILVIFEDFVKTKKTVYFVLFPK